MHQTFINDPLQLFTKAANNQQLGGIPFMKPELLLKYLSPSPATSKGRMKRPRTEIWSARKKEKSRPGKKEARIEDPLSAIYPNAIHTTANMIPNDEPHENNNISCYAALINR